jgi:hypothetical protein
MFDGWLRIIRDSKEIKQEPATSWRNDSTFVARLTRLVKLRDFVDRESITIKDGDSEKLTFGQYYSITFNRKGKSVDEEDWKFLEDRSRLLMSYMTPESLRRFELLFAPKALYWMPIILASVAATSLAISVFPQNFALSGLMHLFESPSPATEAASWRLFGFLVWCITLGAIGAISFLYVNALSIQIDKNVDVTNRNFITMRVILGALFGVVLDLPIGYPGFVDFCDGLAQYVPAHTSGKVDIAGGALLLVPFLIGFSAPLMINILNRLVELIQNLFGVKSDATTPPQPQGSGGP